MNAQFPTTTTLHRGPAHALLAVFVALAVAGGTTVGIVAITSNDGGNTSSPSIAISKAAPNRVLDGSPILRGTADRSQPYAYRHAIAPAALRAPASSESRVLDGSPILRGHVVTHVSTVQGTQRPSMGRPLGFGYTP
jgi:hypothetical protein